MQVSSRIQILLIAGVLIAIGLGLTLYKKIELGLPLTPGERETVWTLESKINFNPVGGPVEVTLALPNVYAGWVLLDNNFTSSGFDFSVQEFDNNRQAKWTHQSIERPTALRYKFKVYRPNTNSLESSPVPKIIPPELLPNNLSTMQSKVKSLRQQTSDSVSFTANLIQQLLQDKKDPDTVFLLEDFEKNKLSVIMDILALAEIPSQTVKGVFLEDGRRRQKIDTLVEIYDAGHWYLFNPETGQQGLPENFFIWQRGKKFILNVVGGGDSQLEFAIVKNNLPIKSVLLLERQVKKWILLDFSIYSLPVAQQGMFKGLLLIPIGALVILLLRVLIGIRTSGTFMPILIALAFMQTTLLTGLITFIAVVGIGLWIRFYLTYLNLLLVARITAVVIVVILLMAALSIVSYKFGFDQFLSVTFLPTIILAWTIERMSILWEEEGGHEVLIQGSGSLLAAILAYLVMTMELVEHLTFNFPELMISLLGVVLLLGKYTGYRLVELYRFSDVGYKNK